MQGRIFLLWQLFFGCLLSLHIMNFTRTLNKFSCTKSPWITKKNHPKKYTPKNYYSKQQSIKHVPSNKSDFRTDAHLCYLSTCYKRPQSTKNMSAPLWRQSNMDFRYLGVCTFHKGMITMSYKADHMKKNLNYFQTQK